MPIIVHSITTSLEEPAEGARCPAPERRGGRAGGARQG